MHIDQYFANTIVIAAGAWLFQLLVATTGGYALSVLKPKYAPILNGLVLATLFVPAVVLLVPLYLTILHPPVIGHLAAQHLLGGVAAGGGERVQHPAGEALLRQPAARGVRGGDAPTAPDRSGVFWSIVLPMSRPILGVVSVFAIITRSRTTSGRCSCCPIRRCSRCRCDCRRSSRTTELDVFLAALAISTIIPIVLFLVFQRVFLRSAGLGGAVKG